MVEPTRRCPTVHVQFRADACGSVHGVYEGMWDAISFRHRPSNISFRYGTTEIGDGLLAVECDSTKSTL
jgi:hypothetical protein